MRGKLYLVLRHQHKGEAFETVLPFCTGEQRPNILWIAGNILKISTIVQYPYY
jgi:hypothetical protein